MAISTIDARRKLCASFVTLNGKPAKISGVNNTAATVWIIASPQTSADFAWSTVAKIVERGGDFSA